MFRHHRPLSAIIPFNSFLFFFTHDNHSLSLNNSRAWRIHNTARGLQTVLKLFYVMPNINITLSNRKKDKTVFFFYSSWWMCWICFEDIQCHLCVVKSIDNLLWKFIFRWALCYRFNTNRPSQRKHERLFFTSIFFTIVFRMSTFPIQS